MGSLARRCRSVALGLLVAGAGARAPVASADRTKPALSAEWRYVFERDDAAAAKLLDPLLRKYPTPKACDDLVKVLRGRRSYPTGLPDQATLEHACTDGKTRQFTYLLPKKLAPGKPAGVLVFLHGAVSQPAPGGGANEARLFAPAVERLGLIVVGPSTYDRVHWSEPACRELVQFALEYVKESFPVDENRVYLAGDSDGGRGAYATIETAGTFFACAVPVIGAPGGVTRFGNLRNLPWLAYNGGKDTTFPVDEVRAAVEGMKAAGIDLTWRLFDDAGHDPYLFTKHKDEICDFLAKHPRDPLPKTVHLEVDPAKTGSEAGFPANTMRWVRVDTTGSSEHDTTFEDASAGWLRSDLARVRAKRDGNRIDLETRGVKALTVLLTDAMVDLSKDVEIRTNGRLSFRGRVEADARAILEEARRFRDRALVFQARVAIDVDAPEPAAPDAAPAK